MQIEYDNINLSSTTFEDKCPTSEKIIEVYRCVRAVNNSLSNYTVNLMIKVMQVHNQIRIKLLFVCKVIRAKFNRDKNLLKGE